MHTLLRNFLDNLLLPLSFLPPAILTCFNFAISFFSLYVVGRLWSWLFSIIPKK